MGTYWATFGQLPNHGTSDYLATFALLFVFGLAYNWAVAEIERRKIQGYTWHEVALGVGVAVIVSGVLIGFWNSVLVLACLVACGTPMIAGAHLRHEQAKQAELARLKALVGDKVNDAHQA